MVKITLSYLAFAAALALTVHCRKPDHGQQQQQQQQQQQHVGYGDQGRGDDGCLGLGICLKVNQLASLRLFRKRIFKEALNAGLSPESASAAPTDDAFVPARSKV